MVVRLNKVLPVIVRGDDHVLVSTFAALEDKSIVSIYPEMAFTAYTEVITSDGEWDKSHKKIMPISFEGQSLFAVVSDLEGAWQEIDSL